MEIVNSIKSAIQEIESFFNENGIDFFSVSQKGNRYQINFIINVKSYISKTELADTFHFILELRTSNNLTLFEIFTHKDSKIPFHPHFKVSKKLSLTSFIIKEAKWLGHSSNEDIISFIKRMILSLQFYKGYIVIEPSKIGNEEAKQWYLEEFYKNSNKFPTDVFLNNPIKVTSVSESVMPDRYPTIKIQSNKTQKVSKLSDKKKFTINEHTNFNLESKAISEFNFEIDNNLKSIINTISSTKLYISVSAKKKIWNHIKWGNLQTPINKNEQGGILLGKVYFDPKNQIQFGIVEQIVCGKNAKGNSVYLEMNHATWSQMLNEADKLIDGSNKSNIQVIGWYHTHPNNLDVFMSSTDMNTQQRLFNQSWHYAIVLNPHKRIWKAFVGKEARVCQGFFLKDKISNNYDEEENTISKHNINTKLKDIIIILLVLALACTIGYLFHIKRKANSFNIEDNSLIQKSINKKYVLILNNGDTIDITNNSQLIESFQDNELFYNELYSKKNNILNKNDSTVILLPSCLYLKDTTLKFSKFGVLRDTLSIPLLNKQIDSSLWFGFYFKGLIRVKDE